MKKTIASVLVTLLLSACATTPAQNAAQPSNVKEWLALQSRAKKKRPQGAGRVG